MQRLGCAQETSIMGYLVVDCQVGHLGEGGATRWDSWERVGQLGGAAGRGWGNYERGWGSWERGWGN